ncbi:serine/threonine-protein kinase polo-like [Rhodnius prolixus]|uniref:serine/threonine-protein kinase polo-like n=1 Tax=Rhodnius prolixus TaxID=13249 RepID=UPI003D189D59
MCNQEDEQIPKTIHDTNNAKTYTRQEFFGKGGFAKCYKIMDLITKQVYAGKIISKKLLSKNYQLKMSKEIDIHKSLSHKNIVKFYGSFEDQNFIYMILELCSKRSMIEFLQRRKKLTEPEVRYYLKQILEGVLYLHEKLIIHRDLKLANLFLNDNLEVKIGDFGLATKCKRKLKTYCGTPNYVAPEILNKQGHSFEVDVWSIGCIMYTLLCGNPPFETNSLRETCAKIKRCEYFLPPTISEPAASMIHQMLSPNPDYRPSISQLLELPFMNGYCPKILPTFSLTIAPRFNTFNDPYCRTPIVENKNLRKQSQYHQGEFTSFDCQYALPSTNEQCKNYLFTLLAQLRNLLKNRPQILATAEAEEMTDPDAQPFVWISKWVDSSNDYGFGYQLCDDAVGAMFQDSTKALLLPNKRNLLYFDSDGREYNHVLESIPPSLEKKIHILKEFIKYMDEHLEKAGASVRIQEFDNLSSIPHLHVWSRTSTAVIMQLTNGTVQINFVNHNKIILCPLMASVTHVKGPKAFRTYKFITISKQGCVYELLECLNYAYKKLNSLIPLLQLN